MKEDIVSMTQKERHRYHCLRLVNEGEIKLEAAAQSMGVSYRQAKRLLKQFRLQGARGLVHGNRGSPSPKRLDLKLANRILKLSDQRYADFNDVHFTEKLHEAEGITVSDETVRKLRRAHQIKAKRRHRCKKHHKRRPRKSHEGMMMLWDGSPHHWFGNDKPPCCLMSSIDDATGKWLAACFVAFEGSYGYLQLLWHIVTHYGIPLCVYQDQHSALHRTDTHWTLEEQLAGKRNPTQVGMALRALGITPIIAQTPQAKGRIERLFGVLQDRLIPELRQHRIKTIEAANTFLVGGYMDNFNRRFAVEPEMTPALWRKVPASLDLTRAISFRYPAVVGNDNAVRLGGMVIDIPAGPGGRSYAKLRIDAHQLLDGSWKVFYKDRLLATAMATPLKEPLRARKRNKYAPKGAKQDTWIYLASAP